VREQGVITRVISPELVEVACQRSEACKNCQACHDVGENMMAIEAVNQVKAKKDDVVEFELSSQEMIKGSLIVFVVPMLALITGYLLTVKLFQVAELLGVLGGLVAMGLSYVGISWYDKRVAIQARLIRVISSS
jgi:sigma-E factor negative regulatory protein RseC